MVRSWTSLPRWRNKGKKREYTERKEIRKKKKNTTKVRKIKKKKGE